MYLGMQDLQRRVLFEHYLSLVEMCSFLITLHILSFFRLIHLILKENFHVVYSLRLQLLLVLLRLAMPDFFIYKSQLISLFVYLK
jgi:hypothetical protein